MFQVSAETCTNTQFYPKMTHPFSSRLKHESVRAFQNRPGVNIQLHAAGSVEGQPPNFSRKLASKQSALRVSSDKQTVTVCTQGECYQSAIISRQGFFLPKDLPKHASH